MNQQNKHYFKLFIFFLLLINSSSFLFAKDIKYSKSNIFCDSYCQAIQNIKHPKTREKALDNLLSMALDGDARAKTQIGEIFIFGEYGIKQDCRKGLIFLLEALNKNKNITDIKSYNPKALKVIAKMFKYGICVKQDTNKYLKYINRYFKRKKEIAKKKEKNKLF